MSAILPIYERACHLKTIKSKKLVPRKPSMPLEIMDETILGNRLYEIYLDDWSDEAFDLFKTQMNLVDKLRRNKIYNFYNYKFEDSKGNMKETWRTINYLISDKGDKKNEEVCFSGFDCDDKSAAVNKLGKFFSNIGSEIQASVYDKY